MKYILCKNKLLENNGAWLGWKIMVPDPQIKQLISYYVGL